MTSGLVVDLKGKYPYELAEDDPELMRLWGEINNAWDNIERLLYVAFDSMLSEETSYSTQAVFYSQTSHAARRTMVEALAKYALLNRPKTAKKLALAIKRVKARSHDRNKLAHGTWVYGLDLKSKAHESKRIALDSEINPNEDNIYNKERLKEVKKQMIETALALREAIDPIEEAKRLKSLELSKKHLEKAVPLESLD